VEVKQSVPCHRFVACKISLNVTRKSAFRRNYRILFSPISSTFRCSDLSRRVDVEAPGGDSGNVQNKGGGLKGSHNRPKGCGASGAYAPGPDGEGIRKLQIRYEFKRYDRGISMYRIISTELTTKLPYRPTEIKDPRRRIELPIRTLRQREIYTTALSYILMRIMEPCSQTRATNHACKQTVQHLDNKN
jgi:hypothetical protein